MSNSDEHYNNFEQGENLLCCDGCWRTFHLGEVLINYFIYLFIYLYVLVVQLKVSFILIIHNDCIFYVLISIRVMITSLNFFNCRVHSSQICTKEKVVL